MTSQTIYAVLSRMEISRLSPSYGDDAKAQGAHVPPSRIGRARTHNGRSSHLIMALGRVCPEADLRDGRHIGEVGWNAAIRTDPLEKQTVYWILSGRAASFRADTMLA